MAKKRNIGLGEPTTTVAVKLVVRQREKLEALAQAERRSLSSVIRNVLDDFLAVTPQPKARRIAAFELPPGVTQEEFFKKKK